MWIATDCGITHIIVVDDPTAQELQYRCYSYLMKMVLGILHLTTTQFIVTGKAKF